MNIHVLLTISFDPIPNDYKLLRIVNYVNGDKNSTVTCKLEAEMYSANADSGKKFSLPKTLQHF